MNIGKIIDALENKQNDNILNLTFDKIKNINSDILTELKLPNKLKNEHLKSLKHYYFVDEITNLKHGTYIRWINMLDPEKVLSKGAIFCDIKITDDGTKLVCKTFLNRYFQLKMDEYLIFEKLTYQEQIILEAIHKLL
jgi:hypothetical protein